MPQPLLLDTHILIRWLLEPKRLSRGQMRTLDEAVSRQQSLTISAMTLLEIGLFERGYLSERVTKNKLFSEIESNPFFGILPITLQIVREMSSLASLRDPADRAIVATARVHGLRLMTSDQRIIESNMVSTIG